MFFITISSARSFNVLQIYNIYFDLFALAYSHLGPFIDVYPLDMGNFLTTQFSSSSPNIVLIKIDTEGYEPIILEAILDFCKHSITNGNAVVVQNFIIEVTSKSWASFEVHTYTYILSKLLYCTYIHRDNAHVVCYHMTQS